MQFSSTVWVCFRGDSTIIYGLWFFSRTIAFLRVYSSPPAGFKFTIPACILQLGNVMYGRTLTSIAAAPIKSSKNFRQRISCYGPDLPKVQRQRISCYGPDLPKVQRQRIFLMIRSSIHSFLALSGLAICLLILALHMLIDSRTHVTQLEVQSYSPTYLSWQLLGSFMYIPLLALDKPELQLLHI